MFFALFVNCLTGMHYDRGFYVLKLCRRKPPAKICWKYIFTALCGIGAGVILFFADACAGQLLQPPIKHIIHLLEHSAWMEYPAL